MKLIQISSITKKIALAAFGLFLLLFLPVHLGINLCILRDDGGLWYRAASHFMGTNYIVKVFEIVLMACVAFHIIIAIIITIENFFARPVRYKVRIKSKTSLGSRYMIWTGGIIACFLVLHFINFYFVKHGLIEGKYTASIEKVDAFFQENAIKMQNGELSDEKKNALIAQYQNISEVSSDKMDKERKNLINLTKQEVKKYCGEDFTEYEPDFYTMSIELFKNKTYSIIYLLVFIALGLHLSHAIKSLAQTLGLSHKTYNPFIVFVANFYAIVIPIGFAIIPLAIMF
ncbi:MAG: succinate dehydrogenase cytochrome b subunit [Bacteroidales bacterium]|jgi:succinate dehydrogenase/fumarate reductase cytochrome b subunit (b558 family)|nr:succinate dehydrogenase cytochrome b subunit [Bacteroidales bacterium]